VHRLAQAGALHHLGADSLAPREVHRRPSQAQAGATHNHVFILCFEKRT
jgi:hypothetical protein